MNQKKYKIGKIILTFILSVAFYLNYTTVFADDEKHTEEITKTTCETDYKTKKDIDDCINKANQCFESLYPATFYLEVKIKDKDKNNYIIVITNNYDKEVEFNLAYKILTDNKVKIDKTNEPETVKVGKKKTKEITVKSQWSKEEGSQIYATITLTTPIKASVKGGEINCQRKFNATAQAEIPEENSSTFHNPDYKDETGSICDKYIHGTLTESDLPSKDYEKLLPGKDYSYDNIKGIDTPLGLGKDVFEDGAAYCYNEQIKTRLTKKNLFKLLEKVAKGIYNSKRAGSETNKMDPLIPGSVEVNNLNDAINLTCDAVGTLDPTTGSYKSGNNTRTFYHYTDDPPKYAEYHYRTDKTEKVKICDVKCREDLTITYGPPVAVTAGFCFEYEVKVESRVTCDSYINTNGAPKIENYEICEPTPVCSNGSSQYINQAGPNEDFDQCIQEKFNGKYTQKAINYCYNKVYSKKNKTKTTNLNLNYTNIERMNNTISQCDPSTISKESEADAIYDAYSKEGYFGGYYKPFYNSEGEFSYISWVPYGTGDYKDKAGNEIPTLSGCYWNKYARFYFNTLNRTRRTVGNDGHIRQPWGSGYYDDLNKWKYYPDEEKGSSTRGIKVGYAYGNKCHDECSYISYCDGQYYNYVAPKSETEKNSAMSALDQYYNDYNSYEQTIIDCSAASKCDTTTSTYKMTINNLEGTSTICEVGDDNKNCTSWTDTGKSKNQCEYNTKNPSENGITAPLSTGDSTKTSTVPLDTVREKCTTDLGKASIDQYQETSIREISGVCAGVPGDNQHYRTIIGFPGSWYYAKNSSYIYHNPNNVVNYQFVPGKYCVGFTIKESINKAWWNWDQVTQRSASKLSNLNTETKTDAGGKQITVLKNGKYNIKAFIETFGQANWKFNISCFYATSKTSDGGTECTTGDEKCCYTSDDECCGEKCTGHNDNPINHTIKAAALDDLFPATENTSSSGVVQQNNTTKSVAPTKLNMVSTNNSDSKSNLLKVENSTVPSRTTGFNWTCEATTLAIKNYPIAPTALITKIQTVGDGVYNDKKEVDYAFRITPDQISNIRDDNNSRKDNPYAIVGENYYKNNDNNLQFYKSSLLDGENVTDIAPVKRKQVKHTCNNMRNGKCDNLTQYIKANAASCNRLSN